MKPLPDLPVVEILGDVTLALEAAGRAVLVAPPGAGKTTLVPLHLLGQHFLAERRIIVVEPRRLAARAAATRMAELLQEAPGGTVGWRMRLDTRVSSRTRIEIVTEGVFSRMVLGDPELAGIGAVLFDEFHERSLDADFGLALALDVQGALRPDLRILVMSATLDGARVARLLGDAPVIESAGRSFPIDIRYREGPAGERIEEMTARAILEALSRESGSLLAFLPGQREIERTAERLRPRLPNDVLLAPLFGAMDKAAQDLAIRPAPAGTRKIVLATSIAETSLTIDGVTTVVDSGWARRPAFEPATGLSRLQTVRVSQAAAAQRAGRAGRTAPGVAIRLWRAEQTAAFAPFDPPEILSSDLSRLVLDCAAWGVADPAQLPFLDPPPAAALIEARALLRELGALDADGRLGAIGLAMRDLALPPRLACMVVKAAPGQTRRLAARLAVLLTERGLGGADVDLSERLRRAANERGGRVGAAEVLAQRLAKGAPHQGGGLVTEDPGELLALAYPDRVAIQRGAPGHFLMANGRAGRVAETEALAGAPALVVAELQGEARAARILSAAAISRRSLEAILAERVMEEDRYSFDRASRSVRARRVRRLGAAVLTQAPLEMPDPARIAEALLQGIREIGLTALAFGKEGESLRRRLAFLHRTLGDPWPDVGDNRLLAELEEWLMPFLPGVSSISQIDGEHLRQALLSLVPAHLAPRLAELAPSHYRAPTGSNLPIRYEETEAILPVRVQELFGVTSHPAIAEGRLPLTLELLSPAHRPIQITRDLPGFWAGSWRDVRADLRGRYPKHPWPEDPAGAPPTARAKPRR